jgi:hypothetical protein
MLPGSKSISHLIPPPDRQKAAQAVMPGSKSGTDHAGQQILHGRDHDQRRSAAKQQAYSLTHAQLETRHLPHGPASAVPKTMNLRSMLARVAALLFSLSLLAAYVVYSHVTPNTPPPDPRSARIEHV